MNVYRRGINMDRKNLWWKAHLFCLLLYIIYKDLLEWAYFDYEIGIPFYNNNMLKGLLGILIVFQFIAFNKRGTTQLKSNRYKRWVS